jgi:hypothetical protein
VITKIAAVLICLIAGTPAMAAEVSLSECRPAECFPYDGFLVLRGAIQSGDAAAAALEFSGRKTENGAYPLIINSPGGSVVEAMTIGRWARQERLSVSVTGECLSACVYVLAGGVARWPNDKVGIHRPYIDAASDIEAGEELRRIEILSGEYFKEMNIPISLSDDMFSTPPEDMHFLSRSDLRKYRLDQVDMVEAEEKSHRDASRLGISRTEYNKRLSALKQSGAMADCEEMGNESKLTCVFSALANFGLLFPKN